jgi:hypothetical protein
MQEKKIIIRFLILLQIFSMLNLYAKSQNINLLIIGDWRLERNEFIFNNNSDSTDINKESIGTIVSFKKFGKFSTTKKEGFKKLIIANGNYRISKSKKFLFQDEIKSEIILLNKMNLSVKVNSELILHFKRLIYFKDK